MVKAWNELSVLVAGSGSIGRRHARVLSSLGVQDIRACDPLPGQREALLSETPTAKMYSSFEAGLEDKPDTVLICTPPKMHIPMALQAIQAGCHVLCEKPLSDSPEGIDELAQTARDAGKKVMVALCFRYHEGLVKAKHLLDSGRLGRLVSVRALMGEHLPDVRPDYRDLFSSKYLGALDLSHEIDLAIWYASGSVRSVKALSRNYSDIGIQAPDVVELLMDFDNRCMASVHLDYFQRPRRRQTELICTGGVAIIEFARWDSCTFSWYESASNEWQQEQFVTDRDDMFRAEDKEFLEAVATDGAIASSIEEASKSVRVVASAMAQS